jgi:hypothetical protein
MNKAMPIGVEDFKEIREKYYFVDKTDFIRQLIDAHSNAIMITRPRRFGKTLTMSMLDYFFSIDRKKDSASLFQGLAIERAGSDYMKHQGQYPVVSVSLKNIQGRTWNDMLDDMSIIFSDMYRNFGYLMQSNAIDDGLKVYFQKILYKKATPNERVFALVRLTDMLKVHYGKPAIVLIDEYDAPIQQAWECGFYNECTNFMQCFLGSALKTNESLDFAVLTGVFRIITESIFSGLNNLDDYSILRDKYSNVFGFTPQEVAKLTSDVGKQEVLPELKQWYDGYQFGNTEIYNPLSVISYIDNHCLPQPYWMKTSNNSILRELVSHADYLRMKELLGLLHDIPISVSLNEDAMYDQIGKDRSAVYTMLLLTGYLAVSENIPTSYARYLLRIPNEEIKQVYSMEILNTIIEGVDKDTFDRLFNLLCTGQNEDFTYLLQKILLRFASTYDTANKESFYHGFMLGMAALFLGRSYAVESNRESGYGRFDLAIFPKDTSKAGVLMEFKAAECESMLQEKSQEALQQIEDKKYDAEFAKRGITTVWKYGVAFCGKKVQVVMK